MRFLLILLLPIISSRAFSQDIIFPGNKTIQTKWIKEETYTTNWYMVKDTARREMGTIITTVSLKDNKIFIAQQVSLKGMKAPWVDSAIADFKTIAPVYHSSVNGQRSMALHYRAKTVDGYYTNNSSKKTDIINDSTGSLYFDSNMYTSLLSWLPLKEGYTVKLPVYDYNSSQKHGLVYVTINSVKKGKYLTGNNIEEDVFILDVTDGISEKNAVYYISTKNRQLLKMTSALGTNTMEIVRVM